jgi:hypothetical protein
MVMSELITKVIKIFSDNLSKIELVKIDGEPDSYSIIIFRPLPDVKTWNELRDLQLTGFRIFLEKDDFKITLKIWELELVVPRGGAPRWAPSPNGPIEQVAMQDLQGPNTKLFKFWDKFEKSYDKWLSTKADERLDEITKELDDYKNKLSFDDPFQAFLAHALKEQEAEAAKQPVESYQQEPQILDFQRVEDDE